MGLLDVISQMFSSNSQTAPAKGQKTGQMKGNKGSTTMALSMRDEYNQYQMQMQELGQPAMQYEVWLAMKQEEMKAQK